MAVKSGWYQHEPVADSDRPNSGEEPTDFERLLGLLSESVQELQTRILYAANGLLAIETADGLRVIYNDRLVAFIPYQP